MGWVLEHYGVGRGGSPDLPLLRVAAALLALGAHRAPGGFVSADDGLAEHVRTECRVRRAKHLRERVDLVPEGLRVDLESLPSPLQIAMDDDNACWTEGGATAFDGKLVRIDKQGGPLFEVFGDLGNPWALALDDKSVFYGENGTWRWNIALDDGLVYFSTFRVPKQSGPTQELASADHWPWCVAVDEEWIYWTDQLPATSRPEA